MLQNVAELATMKLCIGRNGSESAMPNTEHQLQIIGTILGDDGDAFTGLERETIAQRRRKPCGAPGDFAVTPNDSRAQSQRGPIPVT